MKKILFTIPLILLSFFFLNFSGVKSDVIEIKHTYYTSEYDTAQRAEILGYYIQTKEHALISLDNTKALDRKGFATFRQDPLIPEYIQDIVTNDAYYNWNHNHPDKKIDKGHVVPYSAMDFDSTAAYESMYLENTNPQVSYFNEHQWEAVEMYVLKTVAPTYGDTKVWTGCLISKSNPVRIDNLYMPDFYWKVIQYKKNGILVEEAWLGSNKFSDPKDTNPSHILSTPDKVKQVVHQYYPDLKIDF